MQQGAGLGIKGGKRLVHQQHRRVHHQGTGDGDPLTHPARQFVDQLVALGLQVDQLQGGIDPALAFGLGQA